MASIRLERGRRSLNPILATLIVMSIIWSAGVVVSSQETSSPATNPEDLRVLHEIMYAMNYENDWATLVPDPCVSSPQGIVCEADPVSGVLFVTQLQFGFISPIANIIPCAANATIPASIGSLTRLTSLSFYSCFTNQSTTLPPELGLLGPSLRLLLFIHNPALTGALPSGLGNLTGLQRLVLSESSLSGTIPAEIASLPALVQLDLSHNELSGAIPQTLANSSLVNLDLRYNALEGDFPAALAQGLHHLQRLALSHNKLTSALPDAFTGLESLTFLDLSFNELTGALPPSLGGLVCLEDLFLNANRFNGAIPKRLSDLRSLVRLDLSSCEFGGVIPRELQRLESLRFLSVSNNRLSGAIPASLASLPVLFTLNLDGNQLSGPVPFPASFVQRMGRNLQLGQNAGLCYSSSIQLLLSGLQQCPESVLTTTAPSPTRTASPGLSLPNGAHSLFSQVFFSFAAALISCLLSICNP